VAGKRKQGQLRMPDDLSWQKDTWQHICAVWRINTGKKDGVLKLYLNGERVGRRTDFRAYKIDLGPYLMFVPNGIIDELKIWDRILTDEEIGELYNKEKAFLIGKDVRKGT